MTETDKAALTGKGVAVIIPCYNEAVTIGKVVDDFKRVLPDADIYVYDNNSKDGTADIAREHGAIVKFEGRQGKGGRTHLVSPASAAATAVIGHLSAPADLD